MKVVALHPLRLAGRLHSRLHGCDLGRGVLVRGFQKITRKPGGRIPLGDGATLNSTRWANSLNDRSGASLSANPGRRCGVSVFQ